jgi:hypothetical protein
VSRVDGVEAPRNLIHALLLTDGGFAAARRPAREPVGGRNFAAADSERAEVEPRVLRRRREIAVGEADVRVLGTSRDSSASSGSCP